MVEGLTASLIRIARHHGAASVGVAGARPFDREVARVAQIKASGRSGPLHFTFDDPETAGDVSRSFPWARSIVVVAFNYLDEATSPSPAGALVGRFATSDHYESVERPARAVARALQGLGYRAEVLIDDNRLLDRAAAARAGVGWIGKSSMLLAPGHGPWMLLGSVVTDALLETTPPMQRTCGTCTACIPACPTGAIMGEGGIDARRCLSTWLQTAGSIPQWIRPRLGRRIYGCDECLDACPPGMRRLTETSSKAQTFSFSRLLGMTDDDLVERFSWWYVPHRDGKYLRRNTLVGAGNSGEPEAVGAIADHLDHPSSMIRSHAAWALARSERAGARDTLHRALEAETSPETRDELALGLLMIERPDTHSRMLHLDEWAGTNAAVRGLGLWAENGASTGFLALTSGEIEAGPISQHPTMTVASDDSLGSVVGSRPSPPIRIYDPDRRLEDLRRLWKDQVGAISD